MKVELLKIHILFPNNKPRLPILRLFISSMNIISCNSIMHRPYVDRCKSAHILETKKCVNYFF